MPDTMVFWIVLAAACLILEVVTVNLVSIWFVAGAVAVLVFGTSATLTIMQERAAKGFQITHAEVPDGE